MEEVVLECSNWEIREDRACLKSRNYLGWLEYIVWRIDMVKDEI